MDKKILIFSTAYYPFVGGAEVAIKEITDRIPDIEFDLITAKMKKDLPFREKVGSVTVYRLGIGIPLIDKLIAPIEAMLFARHLLKKKKYQAFWCMMVSYSPLGAYLYNMFLSPKVPVILTLQEGDSEQYLKTKWFGLINLSWKFVLQRTQKLTVISNYLGERAQRFGFKGEVKLIPNGVDVQKFNRELSEEERYLIRQSLGLKKEDIALITSSRLTKKNGIEDVIKALPQLSDRIKFIVLGDGELNASLHALAKKLHVDDQVIWKGYISHHDLPKYLKASDMFIRPSLSEGMGNSFIEAMAAGLPTIGTPVGGIVDFLKEGETGYLCKPQNPGSIMETIKRVIADPHKPHIIEHAKKLVTEQYDWNKIAVHMKEIFASIAA